MALQNWTVTGIGAFAALLFAMVAAPGEASAQAVCPLGSSPDHAWSAERDPISNCIYRLRDGNLQRGGTVDYNIYCSGRMTQRDAELVGRQITGGRANITGGTNPIVSEHRNAGLTPQFVSVPHVFHYNCELNNRRGVATHIKVRVRSDFVGDLVGWLAEGCTHRGSQNGSVAIGARMDREYRCRRHLLASERGAVTHQVAARLLQRDSLPTARQLGGKICVLGTTDIQCAPCSTSDKLVARVQTVAAGAACPTRASLPHNGPTVQELR